MASSFDLHAATDLRDQLVGWEAQYTTEASYRQYVRACAWVVDETAKTLATSMNGAMKTAFDRPTPWTQKAFQYTRSLGKGREPGEVEAETYVLPDQSDVLKYAVGDGPVTRSPGDVGLAVDQILVPFWDNLRLTQGIGPNGYGNLPGGVMARLQREVGGVRAKSAPKSRWSVWKGQIVLHGHRVTAYIARPPRITAPGGERTTFINGRLQVVSVPKRIAVDKPRILMLAVDKAVYKPVLQEPMERLRDRAIDRIPELMERELAESLRHNAEKAASRKPRMEPL